MHSEPQPLTRAQLAAIRKAEAIGKVLAEAHPEIVTDYRNSASHLEIAVKYIPRQVEISSSVARTAVGKALKSLLSDTESYALYKSHLRESGFASGQHLFQEGKGIHSFSLEERSSAAREGYAAGLGKLESEVHSYFSHLGGKKSARKSARLRTGIYALTSEQRAEQGRKSGKSNYEQKVGIHALISTERQVDVQKGLLAQGKYTYSPEEEETLLSLAGNQDYLYPAASKQPGKPDYLKIRKEIKARFGVDRSVIALRSKVCRLRNNNTSLGRL